MSEEDYKIFFDDAPVALIRTEVDSGRFLLANKFAATLFGCKSVEELVSNNVSHDFYPVAVRNRLIKRLRKSGTIQDEELQLHLNDGRKIWVRANLRLNCGGTCIECFMEDISEVMELREKELNKLKSLAEKIDVRIAASRA